MDTHFSPRTRNEIKCCDWFPIDSLPINKNDAISKTNLGINANSFFMIMPFIKRLKKWVNDNRSGIETRRVLPSSFSPIMTFNNGNGSNCGTGQKCNNNYSTNNNSCKKDDRKDVALANNNSRNSNKRQRHKSMGDLDGIRSSLSNNDNNINSSSYVKSSGGTKTSSSSQSSSTTTAVAVLPTMPSSSTNQYSTPVNSGIVLGGSVTTGNRKGIDKHAKINGGGNVPPKRQLFHSQSQNGSNSNNLSANQFNDDWKAIMGKVKGAITVSSFDLIRKEKNQQKNSGNTGESKTSNNKPSLKPTANLASNNTTCNNQRLRVKSQNYSGQQSGANIHSQAYPCGQQRQQLQQQQPNQKGVPTSKQKPNQNLKRQKSMVSMSSTGYISPPPMSGSELIAVAKAAMATPQADHNLFSQQKHHSSAISVNISTQQLQKMLSITNSKTQSSSIGLMKSASDGNTTHNATGATAEQILKFNPNFDSWTKFSFTKNFIANVFC